MAERTPPTAAIRQAWIGAHPFRTTTTVEEHGWEVMGDLSAPGGVTDEARNG